MKQYHDLLQTILDTGIQQPNRTGIDTLTLPGAMLKFDLREGFPAVTTKKLAFNTMKGELIGFMNAYDSAERFRELGCKIWDANANKNEQWLNSEYRGGDDDLGRIYGVQWRNWRGPNGDIDQLVTAILKIKNNPTDRRIIISAWRPDEFEQMALPPCHVLYQFIADPKNNLLHLCMYQRSCDMFLGVPFNIASASLLLSIVAKLTGYEAATFTHFLADAHIYVNHVEQVRIQLSRSEYPLPKLNIENIAYVDSSDYHFINEAIMNIKPDDISLLDYQHHDAIKAPMAV
ncbi:MAG: thymidylate synthase [Methylotenera sp.]|nr:MAG: thymidylate synthase [Methylotenera sp.]